MSQLMELRRLEKLIDLCSKKNLRRVKWNGIELEFGGDGAMPPAEVEATKGVKFPDPDIQMPPDERMLFRSTDLEFLEEPEKSQKS